MLSILAWLFFLPGAALVAVPMAAIFNGVYAGDQAMSAVLGLVVAAPGIVLVTIDAVRRGWRRARVGFWGLVVFAAPFIIGVAAGVFCELTGVCAMTQHVVKEE